MEIFLTAKNKRNLDFLLNEDNRLIQNVLFWGEESIGKKTMALYLAERLLCQQRTKNNENCGQCQSCLMFKKNYHPDLLIVESQEKSISIEQIRQLINFFSLKPILASLKIAIIDEAEKLTVEAQNSLLKILEEPYFNDLIILITAYPQKLLPTIKSRLLNLRFIRAKNEEIREFLIEKMKIKQEKAQLIAENANGKIGEAIKMLDDVYWQEKQEAKKKLKELVKGNDFDKLMIISGIQEEQFSFLFKEWLDLLRPLAKEKILIEEPKRKILLKNLLEVYPFLDSTNLDRRLLVENIFLNI
jgi:DNA polymerase-3 subunit delta'